MRCSKDLSVGTTLSSTLAASLRLEQGCPHCYLLLVQHRGGRRVEMELHLISMKPQRKMQKNMVRAIAYLRLAGCINRQLGQRHLNN